MYQVYSFGKTKFRPVSKKRRERSQKSASAEPGLARLMSNKNSSCTQNTENQTKITDYRNRNSELRAWKKYRAKANVPMPLNANSAAV
jgi:hypothetical protein